MSAILTIPSSSLLTFFKRTGKVASHTQMELRLLGRTALNSYHGFLFRRSYAHHLVINKKKSTLAPRRPFFPVMEWQDCSSVIDADIPCSVAFECYSNRELIPQWMPFISSVKVLKDKPDVSRWTLKSEVFGQDVEFSWLARNMQPIPNQKIHWRSLEGLPNRGAVRFYPKGPSSCRIELTVSYEVPQVLAPVASALKPFLENLLLRGLDSFVTFAREYQESVPKS
ncbi:hypothetical protein HPP92_009833 [Vanilla planifolia]|nr:hypothetical protein HPP92_009833 [Vanilla planifolia]